MPEHKRADPGRPGRRRQTSAKVPESRAHQEAALAPGSPLVVAAGASIDAQAARLADPRLPPVQRQALAAGIARLQGNRHLQRAIGPAHAGLSTAAAGRDSMVYLQEEGVAEEAAAEPPAAGFGPRAMGILLPAGPIDIGGEHTEVFDVINLSEAPEGTTFEWAAMYTSDILESIDTPTPPRRGHYELRLRGMAPGTGEVGVWLHYEVPGRAAEDTGISEETVTVNRPFVEMASLWREGPGGEPLSGDIERMRVGEYLRVRVFMGNVSPTYAGLPVRVQISGVGVLGVPARGGTVGALSLTQARVLGPGEYELQFRANNIGGAAFTITPMPGNTPPEAVTGQVTVETHVEMAKEEFLSLCNQANTRIDAADRAARAWLASLSLAYGKAYKDHTDVLRDQAASERLAGDLILGAALAFVPGGIGGIIGSSMRAAQAGDFLIDGVKDLAKYGMRTAGAAARPPGAPGLNAFPQDPLAWRGLEEVRINTELLVATNRLLEWQDRANRNDPDFFLDFSPIEAMEQSLTIRGKRVSELQPVDQGVTAREFEKGMWREWLEQFGYRLVTRVIARTGGLVHHSVERNVGKKIKRRCEALGLDVERYARVAEERERARAARLNIVP